MDLGWQNEWIPAHFSQNTEYVSACFGSILLHLSLAAQQRLTNVTPNCSSGISHHQPTQSPFTGFLQSWQFQHWLELAVNHRSCSMCFWSSDCWQMESTGILLTPVVCFCRALMFFADVIADCETQRHCTKRQAHTWRYLHVNMNFYNSEGTNPKHRFACSSCYNQGRSTNWKWVGIFIKRSIALKSVWEYEVSTW